MRKRLLLKSFISNLQYNNFALSLILVTSSCLKPNVETSGGVFEEESLSSSSSSNQPPEVNNPPSTVPLALVTRGNNRVYTHPDVNGGSEIVFGDLTLNTRKGTYFAGGVAVSDPAIEKSNYLIFNTSIDGYTPYGYNKCIVKGACPNTENQDLFKIALSYDKVVRNMLIKNVEIKNAFVVESGPHTDLFQTVTYKPDAETFNVGDWLVFQDTHMKNSDHNTMIWSGDNFKGIVMQNTIVSPGWLDASFDSDCQKRLASNQGPHCYGNQNISAGSSWKNRSEPQVTWVINSKIATGDVFSVPSQNASTDPSYHGPVILVGALSKNLNVTYFYMDGSSWKSAASPSQKVFRYDSIEDALLYHPRPPFLELSCSGWRNPPTGCTNGMGPAQ